MPSTGEMSRVVRFHEGPLTDDLWGAYEQANRSFACTRAWLGRFDDPAGATLATVGESAFLYGVGGETARLLGRLAPARGEDLGAFCDALFARHPEVRRIETDVVEEIGDLGAVRRPVLVRRRLEDFRTDVSTRDEFESRFRSRGTMLKKFRRLGREHPGFRLEVQVGPAVDRARLADVVRLNRDRMAARGATSGIDESYEERMFQVAREIGYLVLLWDGDLLFAGSVVTRVGSDAFTWCNAHLDAYERYGPGQFALYLGVMTAIDMGCTRCHLLWGEGEHKRRLGFEPAPLAAYTVLRGWPALRGADVRAVVEATVTPWAQARARAVKARLKGRLMARMKGRLKELLPRRGPRPGASTALEHRDG